MNRTLVIHPADPTTDFLSVIYEDQKDWSIITDRTISKRKLIDAIQAHDKIIMLGHGTDQGLLRHPQQFHLIIDSTFVYLLRKKECVCIWCNADVFVMKYDIKGFHTGMIISEYEEAIMFCVKASDVEIDMSNKLFANSIRDSINEKHILKEVKNKYKILNTNPVVAFNLNHIYNNK